MHITYQGYCAIQWKQSSSTTPDPYQVGYKATSTIDNTDCGPTSEYGAFTSIPGLSHDQSLAPQDEPFYFRSQSRWCASNSYSKWTSNLPY